MKHSQQHVGLQEHSIGEIYPWSIRGKGDTLQGFHCITGEAGPRFHYRSETPSGPTLSYRSFEQAHRLATAWVKDAIAEETPIRLACRGCDRDDYDGVAVHPADWSDIVYVRPRLASSAWWNYLGHCPDCKDELDKP